MEFFWDLGANGVSMSFGLFTFRADLEGMGRNSRHSTVVFRCHRLVGQRWKRRRRVMDRRGRGFGFPGRRWKRIGDHGLSLQTEKRMEEKTVLGWLDHGASGVGGADWTRPGARGVFTVSRMTLDCGGKDAGSRCWSRRGDPSFCLGNARR